MPLLDVFRGDAYSTVSLTAAVNKLPYVPARIGQLGLFKKEGIYNTIAMIEEQRGKLYLLPTAARGTNPNVYGGAKRQARSFVVPHIPLIGNVFADDVQNIRAFGSETELQSVNDLVLDKLGPMRQSVEATVEFHRVGALHGLIKDADGTTIYDLFAEFGTSGTPISQTALVLDWTVPFAIKKTANAAKRAIENALGATPYKGIRAFLGTAAYDLISASREVATAYERWGGIENMGKFLRDSQARGEFEYAGIIWEEYRGTIGTTGATDGSGNYFGVGDVVIFPEGVQDLFIESYSPANWNETVNTKGKPIYAKQRPMDWDMGIELAVQSNPFCVCTRPSVLVKITYPFTGTPPA